MISALQQEHLQANTIAYISRIIFWAFCTVGAEFLNLRVKGLIRGHLVWSDWKPKGMSRHFWVNCVFKVAFLVPMFHEFDVDWTV